MVGAGVVPVVGVVVVPPGVAAGVSVGAGGVAVVVGVAVESFFGSSFFSVEAGLLGATANAKVAAITVARTIFVLVMSVPLVPATSIVRRAGYLEIFRRGCKHPDHASASPATLAAARVTR